MKVVPMLNQVLEESRASQPSNENKDVDMSGSDNEDGTAGPTTSRGKENNGNLLFELHIKLCLRYIY